MIAIKRQAGVTLVEAMIGLALSMIVVSSMVGLMSNSMGTATRIIEMSQLTDELRNVMSMMTRDVRRANYSANAAYCYANSDCGLNVAAQWGDINIERDADANACVTFNLDRDFDGDASSDSAGGFQYRAVGGVGRIEMWVGDSSPVCFAGANDWLPVTDDAMVDITEFLVDDSGSFSGTVTGEAGSTVTQNTRQLNIQIEGELLLDNRITRRLVDTIRVRNDYLN